MPNSDPLVHLPDEITLTRDEASAVLFALDFAESAAADADKPVLRRAIRLITAKLWPELGDLLDDDEG